MNHSGDPPPHVCTANTGGQYCAVCGRKMRNANKIAEEIMALNVNDTDYIGYIATAITEARREALEEAAKIADRNDMSAWGIAHEICVLAEENL